VNKFFAAILAFCLMIPSVSFADPPEWILQEPPTFELAQPLQLRYDEATIPGARIFSLRLNQAAPSAGVLLNAEANAWIISQFDYVQMYWITEMNRRLDLTRTWAQAERQALAARHNAEVATCEVQVENARNQNLLLTQASEHLIKENRRTVRLYRVMMVTTVLGAAFVAIVPIVNSSR
jgi:hypothetical protein